MSHQVVVIPIVLRRRFRWNFATEEQMKFAVIDVPRMIENVVVHGIVYVFAQALRDRGHPLSFNEHI